MLPGRRPSPMDREMSYLDKDIERKENKQSVSHTWHTRAKAKQRQNRHLLVANIENIIPVLISKVLLVVSQAMLSMDRTTTADNTGHTISSHGDEPQEDTSVDGPVIDALLGLFDEGLPEDFPIEIFDDTIDLLQSLIDGHRTHLYIARDRDSQDDEAMLWCSAYTYIYAAGDTYGNGGIAHDPFTSLMNVLSRT